MESTLAPAVEMPGAPAAPPFRPHPLAALVLSLLGPALGHVHAGRARRGILVFALTHAALLGLVIATESLPPELRGPALAAGVAMVLLNSADAVFVAARARRTGIVRTIWQGPWATLGLVAVGLAVGSGLRWGVDKRVRAFRFPHDKMTPTVLRGDQILVRPLDPGGMRRGRVVGYETQGTVALARVAALGGDTVEMRDGLLLVNHVAVPEPWAIPGEDASDPVAFAWQRSMLVNPADSVAYAPTTNTWGPLVVPAGTWIALGDNRGASLDSRHLGPLPMEAVGWEPTWIYLSRGPDGVRWERTGLGIQPGDD